MYGTSSLNKELRKTILSLFAHHSTIGLRNGDYVFVSLYLMSGEVRISMPTDLRHDTRAKLLRLQLDEDSTSTYSSWRKRGITSLTVTTPTRPRFCTDETITPQKARWKTPEFIVYALVVSVAVLVMVRVPIRLSDSESGSRDIYFPL